MDEEQDFEGAMVDDASTDLQSGLRSCQALVADYRLKLSSAGNLEEDREGRDAGRSGDSY